MKELISVEEDIKGINSSIDAVKCDLLNKLSDDDDTDTNSIAAAAKPRPNYSQALKGGSRPTQPFEKNLLVVKPVESSQNASDIKNEVSKALNGIQIQNT